MKSRILKQITYLVQGMLLLFIYAGIAYSFKALFDLIVDISKFNPMQFALAAILGYIIGVKIFKD